MGELLKSLWHNICELVTFRRSRSIAVTVSLGDTKLNYQTLEPRRLLAYDVSPAPVLQWFESSHDTMIERSADLFHAGYGAVWTPPPSRGDTSDYTVGYDVYDRFDLGQWHKPTLYGTAESLTELEGVLSRSGKDLHVDFIMNHNGYSTLSTPGFVEAGGYPGLAITLPDDVDGDFHGFYWYGDEYERLAGLIDIAQEKNHQFIRHPVDPDDPQNIPAGTTPAFGRLANIPDENNRQFYPDIGHNTIYVYDPVTGESDIPVHSFNTADPMAGDPTVENAMGMLMRNAQWLVQTAGVDGLRIDAGKHMQGFTFDYFDRAVYRTHPETLLDGSPKHVFSYSETYDANPAVLLPHVKKTINPFDPGTIGGNRDTLDFKWYFACKDNLENYGQGGAWFNVKDAGLDVANNGTHDGSAGVKFVENHDVYKPWKLSNVSHALMLMLPGNAVVYFNGGEFGEEREFPKPGRDDALSQGSAVTKLVEIRETHGKGDYEERWCDNEGLYIFERISNAVVALSNRGDWGFDERTVEVGFAPGTKLVELTGNAANALVDPYDDIPEVVTVWDGGDGKSYASIRVPRNLNADGYEHQLGYVIYGLGTPQASTGLELTGVDDVWAGSTNISNHYENGKTLQSDIHVVTGDSLGVRLQTNEVRHLGLDELRDIWADGDYAMLKLDGGIDINQNGYVDVVTPGETTYGFEHFSDKASPLIGSEGISGPRGDGEFLETIDTTALSDGLHFLEARAFRHRTDGGPPAFTAWKEVFYLDRIAPPMEIFEARAVSNGSAGSYDVVAKSIDATADSVHLFANLSPNLTDSEIIAMAASGQGTASRVDTSHFKTYFSNLSSGNNVFTVVAYEPTGTVNVQRISGQYLAGVGLGFGDLNYNGAYDVNDIDTFSWFMGNGGSEFSPAGDLSGDGLINFVDYELLGTHLASAGADPSVISAYNAMANTSPITANDSYSTNEDSTLSIDAIAGVLSNDSDPDWQQLTASLVSGPSQASSFTLDVDGSFSYQPLANFNGSDTFTYAANDGYSGVTQATVDLSISPINDSPQPTNIAVYTRIETLRDINLTQLTSDLETNSSAIIYAVNNAVGGEVQLLGDGVTARFIPESGFIGTGSFTYSVTDDGDGASSPITISGTEITVEVVPDTPPTASLLTPASGSVWPVGLLNAAGYIDVLFSDQNEGIDPAWITGNEISLGGDGVGAAVLDGTVQNQSGGTYRYTLSGSLVPGLVTVSINAGSFTDLAGSESEAASSQFLVIADPPQSAGGDVSPPALLEWFETSWATMSDRAADLFDVGYGGVWTPPPGRGIYTDAGAGIGYDVYDRFDLGSAQDPTLYGTETGYMRAVEAIQAAGGLVYADYLINHASSFDLTDVDTNGVLFAPDPNDPSALHGGSNPGFVQFVSGDVDGDFHPNPTDTQVGDPEWEYQFQLAQLYDIDHRKTHSFIRQPVDANDPDNIPMVGNAAFLLPEFEIATWSQSLDPKARMANVPTELNRRFYPDQTQYVTVNDHVPGDPSTPGNGVVLVNFSGAESANGIPIAENANAYLMRYARWMIQHVGIDGFRVDAARHVYPFVHDFYDRAVYLAEQDTLLDGSPKHVFSFLESFTGDKSHLQTFISKDIDPADLTTVGGNRDVLDMPLFFALEDHLTNDGYSNNWHSIIDASQDVNDDGLANNGSQSVAFVRSHDEEGAYLSSLAHAYVLTRPGNAVVYFNAREFNQDPTVDERPFPHDGTRSALGGHYGDAISRLIDIRNTHGRGDFNERWIDPAFSNFYAFERDGSMIVGLNSRHGGFGDWDSRTIQTNFAEGTLLVELTGNASNPTVDTNAGTEYEIPEVITVGADGNIELRVPQTINGAGVEHGLGYVIYGPATPQGTLTLSNVESTLAADPASALANPTSRLTEIDVIASDGFEVRLDTLAVEVLGDSSLRDTAADGYFAALRLDAGIDLNGITGPNGNVLNGVDYVTPGSLLYGFEDFTETNAPGSYSLDGNGIFTQSVDATQLDEGRHYLTVRAFRGVGIGNEPIYKDFKRVVLIDRVGTEMSIGSLTETAPGSIDLIMDSNDHTAQSVVILVDLPAATSETDILLQAASSDDSTQIDVHQFASEHTSLGGGNHVFTVVATEESGRQVIRRIAGQSLSGTGAGLGDLNSDGTYTPEDITSFASVVASNNALFSAAADFDGDGTVDSDDTESLRTFLLSVGASAETIAEYDANFGTPPTFNGGTFSTDENPSIGITLGALTASDPEGQAIAFSVVSNVDPNGDGNPAVDISGNLLRVLDNGDFDYEANSTLSVIVGADDGAFTTTAVVTINLNDVNESPVFADFGFSVLENSANGTELITLDAVDPEGSSLTFEIEDAGSGTFDINNAVFVSGDKLLLSDSSYLDFETSPAPIMFTVSVSDGVKQTTATAMLTLLDANEYAPLFSSQNISVNENISAGMVAGMLIATDQDNDSVAFEIIGNLDVDGDGNTAYRIENDMLVVNDAGDLNYEVLSVMPLSVRASDGQLFTDATVTVSLNDLNEIPEMTSVDFSLPEHSVIDTIVGTLVGADEDGDSLTFSIINNDDLDADGIGTFRIDGTDLLVNDADDVDFESGPIRNIAIRVSDGELASTSPVVVYLSDIDDPPTIVVPSNATVDEDTDLVFSVAGGTAITVSDQDAQYITTMWMQLSVGNGTLTLPDTTGLTLSTSNGTAVLQFSGYLSEINAALDGLIYRGSENYYGLDTLSIEVSDQSGAASGDAANVIGDVAITVNSIIEGPTFSLAGPLVLLQDAGQQTTPFTIVIDSSIASDQVVLSAASSNPFLTGAITTSLDGSGPYSGSILFESSEGVSGSAVLTITVEDGGLDGDLSTDGDNGLFTDTIDVTVLSAPIAIIDNSEGGFSQSHFTYQNNALTAAAYDGDNHHMQGGSGSASWSFSSLTPGQYRVAAMWAHKYDNAYNAQDAPYTLSDGEGFNYSTHTVDQSQSPNDFESLGYTWHDLNTVTITGDTLVVTLGAGAVANKYVIADAIHLQKLPSLELDIASNSMSESQNAASSHSNGSGVTLITHGHLGDTSEGGYVRAMGEAVIQRAAVTDSSAAATEIQIIVGTSDNINVEVLSAEILPGSSVPLSDTNHSGEILVYLDWGQAQAMIDAYDPWNTNHVSAAVIPYLTGESSIAGLDVALSELPFHLLGHSRGGSLVGALAKDLGETGVFVDQVTYLDPHPLLPGDYDVWTTTVSQNVLYADSVWREDGLIGFEEYWDFDGEHISGSTNVELSEDLLGGSFDSGENGYAYEHGDVTLWYHGTIPYNESPIPNDGTIDVPLDWYGGAQPARLDSGFSASRIAGGLRETQGLLTEDSWASNRSAIDFTSASWPNIWNLEATAIDTQNQIASVGFDYHDYDSDISASFYLDADSNPYNGGEISIGNSILSATGGVSVAGTSSVSLTGVSSGEYHLLGRVDDSAGHTRYAYSPSTMIVASVGGGVPSTTIATVTRTTDLINDLVVTLTSNDLTEAMAPITVTIPAGQASASVTISSVDDNFFDGTQVVTFSASAPGYLGDTDAIEITDDESALTALIDDGEAGFAQSGFSYQNNAQVAAAYDGDNYNLRNGDDADQASWTFTGLDDGAYRVMATWAHKYNNNYNATDAPFEMLDAGSNVLSSVAINQKNAPSQHEAGGFFWDTLDTVYVAGGELKVTLGASGETNAFVVADAIRIEQLVQPTPTLVVQLGEEIVDEDAGSVSGIVSRGAETTGDLVVLLNADATTVGTVPATVTIPDGAGAVPFTLTVVDDAIVDGDQQVAVTATAAGYAGGTDSLLVEDDEFPPVQIIDNGDAGFSETGGFKDRTWAGAYEGDNHYMRGSDGEARWQFTDLIDGEYTVSITWDHISDNKYNATDAPFTIRNAFDEQLLSRHSRSDAVSGQLQ